MRNDLPENCFATLPGMGDLIILKRGETGYYRSDWNTGDRAENQQIADLHNRKCGINPAQVEAMLVGSMCGFDVPGADPQTYLNTAKLIGTADVSLNGVIKDPESSAYYPITGIMYRYQVARCEAHYLEPSAIPKELMGKQSGCTILLDLVQGRPLVPVTADCPPYGTASMNLEDGSYISGKEMNAGYQIIAKAQVGPVEYALGELDGRFPSFVTWERTPANDGDGPPNYYWGHYFDSRDKAIQDLRERAKEKFHMLSEQRKPSIKAQLAAKPVPGDKSTTKPKEREVR